MESLQTKFMGSNKIVLLNSISYYSNTLDIDNSVIKRTIEMTIKSLSGVWTCFMLLII